MGRTTVEDEQNGKLICERIIPFDDTVREVWLKFDSKEAYLARERELYSLLQDSDGWDEVVIYGAEPRAVKRLGKNLTILAKGELLDALTALVGENNLKLIEKNIENP